MRNGEHFEKLVSTALELAANIGAKAVVILNPGIPLELPESGVPLVITGENFEIGEKYISIPVPLDLGLENVLNLISAFLMERGIIEEGDSFIYVSLNLIGIKEAKKGGVLSKAFFSSAQNVIQSLLEIAIELSAEGREGVPVGAIFVLGDIKNVLKHSHQMVPNPFKGYRLNILDKDVKEIIKEFSFLDGAFIFSKTGRVVAAGRYLDVDAKKLKVEVPQGLGSRHIAAAGITKITKAIAITISESGVIRIFKDGSIILEYNPKMRY